MDQEKIVQITTHKTNLGSRLVALTNHGNLYQLPEKSVVWTEIKKPKQMDGKKDD